MKPWRLFCVFLSMSERELLTNLLIKRLPSLFCSKRARRRCTSIQTPGTSRPGPPATPRARAPPHLCWKVVHQHAVLWLPLISSLPRGARGRKGVGPRGRDEQSAEGFPCRFSLVCPGVPTSRCSLVQFGPDKCTLSSDFYMSNSSRMRSN